MVGKSEKAVMVSVGKLLAKKEKPEKVKTGIYLDAKLKERLEALAADHGSSFNALVVAVLEDWLEKNSSVSK
ncbi:MAG: ribbon-helix-helix protein, CopG family [Proteobacteria bacterium]|nr:MAG: ribbon-helix-helix protein, CopG family [Pseudomonadota bacterium]